MLSLMEQTAHLRREWVRPSIKQKFPDPRIVRFYVFAHLFIYITQMLAEFCLITGATQTHFEQKWQEYETLLFKFCRHDDKRALKKLLSDVS